VRRRGSQQSIAVNALHVSLRLHTRKTKRFIHAFCRIVCIRRHSPGAHGISAGRLLAARIVIVGVRHHLLPRRVPTPQHPEPSKLTAHTDDAVRLHVPATLTITITVCFCRHRLCHLACHCVWGVVQRARTEDNPI
jgi:hypothetical protein